MSPVSVKELRARRANEGLPRPGTNPERVLGFLRGHRDQGWRAVELSANLGIEPNTLGSVCRRLRQKGLIDMIDEHWFALEDREVAKRQAMRFGTRLANEKLGPEDARDWPTVPRD